MNFPIKKTFRNSGMTTLLVVGFMGVFVLIMAALTGYALEQGKYGRALYDREQALHSAEAGLEYYRWFLSHNPNNLTNGTGQPGPYTYMVNDPEGGNIGNASITVSSSTQCGQIQWIDLSSVGKSNLNPSFPRTLFARYMRKSVAAYSYVLNSNVLAGADRNITGPYFSNGGIRMDGTNNSDVSSAVSTWVCDSSYGCSPTQNSAPGVLGNGSGSALWHYPSANIDFAGVTVNLANLKTYSQNNGGQYFATATGIQNARGYHILFKSNGTYDVYRVSAITSVPSSTDGVNWVQKEFTIIKTETFVGNYTISNTCGVIFVEDRAWIEGTVKGKVTVAVADLTAGNGSYSPDAILPNNITYATNDGTSGLTVIAEGNVLIPLNSPDTMTLHGTFVAQNGKYGRNLYTNDSTITPSPGSSTYTVPAVYSSYVTRTSLVTNGAVVSNLRTGTSWSCGGVQCSGYQSRTDAYDELQALSPPPFTPYASQDYGFVIWRED